MKLSTITILMSILGIISCTQHKNDPETDGNLQFPTDSENAMKMSVAAFEEIDSTGIILFPLSISNESYKKTRFSYKEDSEYGYWNLIFYNTQTAQYHLLTDKKIIIKSYQSYTDKIKRSSHNYIFYTIISDDYNKDQTLNDMDPDYLYISDQFGNSFRQISPSYCNLINWKLIANTNKVIMTVRKDVNKDLEFDSKDEISTFEIDLNSASQPKEVFSPDFKNQMKILYNKYWKPKK